MATKPSLLVADDEIEIGEIIRAVAEDLGFAVTCVAEGSEVVGLVEKMRPDVIALDLRMPGSDGVEIVRELGKMQCRAGILLMSGMDQRTLTSVQALGKENNLDIGTTLTKPMSIDAIESALGPYATKSNSPSEPPSIPEPVTLEFGLAVLYEPEQQINPFDDDISQRLRVIPQWHLDDDQVLVGDAIYAHVKSCNISKGIGKMVLAQALENLRVWSNQDFSPSLSVRLDSSFLPDLATPDAIATMVDRYCVPREWLTIEVDERFVTGKRDAISEVLSRLRIKGFKISILLEGNGENILPELDSFPIDQFVLDLSQLNSDAGLLTNADSEPRMVSIISTANTKGISVSAINVDSAELLEFAKKCKFNSASGTSILSCSEANEILPLHKEGKLDH